MLKIIRKTNGLGKTTFWWRSIVVHIFFHVSISVNSTVVAMGAATEEKHTLFIPNAAL